MNSCETQKPVLVIPCSGIGKVHGLISREATYLAVDEVAPEQAGTICLALLVKGDADAVDAVRSRACIAIDGCPKACAEKNLRIAGADPVKIIQVTDVLKEFRGAKPGSPTDLTEEGWAVARAIARTVAETASVLRAGREREL